MTAVLLDWLSLVLRWAHVMLGIGWIGTSFFFIWLDTSLRKRAGQGDELAGESWMVHGGGFYRTEKYMVAPESLPRELHWFKYEAYYTWVTGMALLVVIYYLGANIYLIDTSKMALEPWQAILISAASIFAGWAVYEFICRSALGAKTAPLAASIFILITLAAFGYTQVFSDRAAFIHIGIFIGTFMAFNVFVIIIPNQKKIVADLLAGNTPDPRLGKIAKQRSVHNNYLTLPLVFMMLSGHYPLVFGHGQAWLIAMGIVITGALIRHFYNTWEAGALDWSGKAAIPAAGLVIMSMAVLTLPKTASDKGPEIAFTQIVTIMQKHCISCHAKKPSDEDFEEAPKGITFDNPENIVNLASLINTQSVITNAMPLGNKSAMTVAERKILGAWIAQGASRE